MLDDPRIYIQTAGFFAGGIFGLISGIFILSKNPRKPLNILYFLMTIAVATFQISHAIGINIKDPNISRNVLMFNMSNIFLSVFVCHWVLIFTKRIEKLKKVMAGLYIAGLALFIFYLIFPDTFLLPSIPKLYMVNYYNPGSLHWIMRIVFNILIPLFFVIELFIAYRKCTDPLEKNRYKYAFAGIFYGFFVGTLAIALVYDIPIDPMWAMFFGFYPVFFAYAIIEYGLMDISVVAKRAIGYALTVSALILFVGFINFLTEIIKKAYPDFSSYLILVFSSIFTGIIALAVWNKIKEAELLKYEFINIITHKFRTPLTEIKWSADELIGTDNHNARKKMASQISKATFQMVELINALSTFNETEAYLYKAKPIRLDGLAKYLLISFQQRALKKGLKMTINIENEIFVSIDKEKIEFLIGVLVDNAIKYTPTGGEIKIVIKKYKNKAQIIVSDTGIGIAKKDRGYVLYHFYRSQNATIANTEGMGVGLYLSSIIAKRHGGNISFESPGENKGSTFTVTLPLSRNSKLLK